MNGDAPPAYPGAAERLRFAIVHYQTMIDEWGEARAVPQMRKHLGYYLKGFYGASELRERLMRTLTAGETLDHVWRTIERLEAQPERAVA
jgi:tRNA-dihydrouridine synthase B